MFDYDESTLKNILDLDRKGNQRDLFLYDGGCGVCKFLVGFVSERDNVLVDHMRFSPIQTNFAQELCQQYGMPADVSTAILFTFDNNTKEEEQCSICIPYIESDSILRMLTYLQFPYFVLGYIGLYMIPKIIRDLGYRLFAKYRGRIWVIVKTVTGMGDTMMFNYKNKIIGLDQENVLLESWGFNEPTNNNNNT